MSFSDVSAGSLTARPNVATNVAFKDWSLVCDALGQGQQSLILRKGGIAEGRQGFRFKHDAFFLFPTQYHQQAKQVRPEAMVTLHPTPRPADGMIEIRYFFAMEWAQWIDDWELLARLAPFHVWREEVVRERFEYDEQRGLQCAFGRIYRLQKPWSIEDRPSFGGCRSWVMLPDLPAAEFSWQPVLNTQAHEALAKDVRAVLDI